jgi:acylglycerol lipase
MFHGLNSHIGHGAHIAAKMSEYGFVTAGFDHRGFGRSPGKPGKVISQERHLEDAVQFVALLRGEYPELPFFCMGLSMGGMTSYYLTLKYP